jgi:hypothetical protein
MMVLEFQITYSSFQFALSTFGIWNLEFECRAQQTRRGHGLNRFIALSARSAAPR